RDAAGRDLSSLLVSPLSGGGGEVALLTTPPRGRVLYRAAAGAISPPISAGLGWDQRRYLSRSAETMQIIKKCWTEEVFDWEGPHYHLKGVRAMPKPVQQPHPPIFMPARNPRAMERNAREGYGANQGAGRWTLEQIDSGWWRQWHT